MRSSTRRARAARSPRGKTAASVSVRDEGAGIDPAEIPRVFDRFYRGGNDRDGFGLGLAIVAEAVKAIDGELELDSSPRGHGRFDQPSCGEHPSELTKILIAEDEPAILDAVSYTLRGEGSMSMWSRTASRRSRPRGAARTT